VNPGAIGYVVEYRHGKGIWLLKDHSDLLADLHYIDVLVVDVHAII
jgi:hypothetical protein